MAPPGRVKRRLLRAAVRDNVDTMRGAPPVPLRRGTELRTTALRVGLFGGLPILLFLGWSLWSTERPGRAPGVEASAPADAFPAPPPLDPAVFPLVVRKVVLDPGHGGADPGAQTPGGLVEKEVTLDVGQRLAGFLERAGFDVALTRAADETVSLRERVEFARRERADVLVSIHVNSVSSPECRAVETYYVGPAGDSRAETLAGAENQGSGYALADFRRLVEGVYTHARRTESRRLAEAVHGALVTQLASANPALRDLGVKSAPFLVLVASDSPGILAEVSCLSNVEEAGRLAQPGYRQQIAWGLFQGIRSFAEARSRQARPASP
jgi:N-acetylmuramoyl-L-alanine amidase